MLLAAGCGGNRVQIQDVLFELVDSAHSGLDIFRFLRPCNAFLTGICFTLVPTGAGPNEALQLNAKRFKETAI